MRATSALRILLVEDHEDSLAVLRKLLGLTGHQVATATTAGQATTLAAEESYDLLISDLGLPDRTGMDLMRELRALYNLPGIALTGHGEDAYRHGWREAGFSAHLTKPVSFPKLLEAIEEATRRN